jgi:Zn finger protein HypA/HybF involved in hydrogenase expression
MIDEIMKQGKIECECGNIFFFKSMRKEILCMKCGTTTPNNGELVQAEPCETEETEVIDETYTEIIEVEV